MPPEIFKIILQEILHGLDYLHTECRIIHTGKYSSFGQKCGSFFTSIGCLRGESIDLKPDNIMVRLEDPDLLSKGAQDEFENPLPQKHCDDGRIIYLSRKNY